jgi:hypothetical protein
LVTFFSTPVSHSPASGIWPYVNLLRERIGLRSDGNWSEAIGSWGDIYNDEIEKSAEYEDNPA